MAGNRVFPALPCTGNCEYFPLINLKRDPANRSSVTFRAAAKVKIVHLNYAQSDCLQNLLNDNIYYFSSLGNTFTLFSQLAGRRFVLPNRYKLWYNIKIKTPEEMQWTPYP